GSFAHVLLRFAVEARWVPWGLGRVEPWIGAEMGLAAADDYAKWDASSRERGHSVYATRFGDTAGAHVGVRARFGEFIAIEARGGLVYLNLANVRAVTSEPGDTKGNYFVRPTDYARRIWYSVALSAEITVPD